MPAAVARFTTNKCKDETIEIVVQVNGKVRGSFLCLLM